jgi:hypothetical protein
VLGKPLGKRPLGKQRRLGNDMKMGPPLEANTAHLVKKFPELYGKKCFMQRAMLARDRDWSIW